MSKYYTFMILILVSLNLSGQVKVIDSAYQVVTRDFYSSTLNDTIIFKTSGISLINDAQLNAMMEIVDYINSNDIDEASRRVIEANTKIIEESKIHYEHLLNVSNKQQDITLNNLVSTKKSLDEISGALVETRTALELANQNVKTSNDLLKKQKSAKIWQGVLIGLAGIGVGVLITQ